jgi:hypothetical protein
MLNQLSTGTTLRYNCHMSQNAEEDVVLKEDNKDERLLRFE